MRERLAARARALRDLLDLLALRADAIGEVLAAEQGLVAWDRAAILGHAQRQLRRLLEAPEPVGGEAVGVVLERRRQPLECLAPAWGALLRGARVHVGGEAGATRVGVELLGELAERPRIDGAPALTWSAPGDPLPDEVAGWPRIGVREAAPRVALISAEADRELAAYVLARTCLRRAGDDPQAVHQAMVAGPCARLERHLLRLWVGAVIGPAEDPESFAGPASPELADAYLDALDRWGRVAAARRLCVGGPLERAGDPRRYLAPALVRLPWPPPEGVARPGSPALPLRGPILALHVLGEGVALERAAEAIGVPPQQQLWIGPPPVGRAGEGRRHVHGAVVVDLMPPGLPEPRPT
ncbi:MAG: hypothetical protein H6710_02775 [Myxococcales bacterium]|nr:hypothetical protein [Myxococcales bacterium]